MTMLVLIIMQTVCDRHFSVSFTPDSKIQQQIKEAREDA
jgi:hypothetical protein